MSLLTKKHADEIREMWQSRTLRESKGLLRKVMITALSKEYPGAILTLLKVTFPGFMDIDRPMLTSYAHIALDGSIVCEVIERTGNKHKQKIYDTEEQFLLVLRKLADKLKLPDRDRTEMFTVMQKWVASDKRVGIHGQKLAS